MYKFFIVKMVLMIFAYATIGVTLEKNGVASSKKSYWCIMAVSVCLYIMGYVFGILES